MSDGNDDEHIRFAAQRLYENINTMQYHQYPPSSQHTRTNNSGYQYPVVIHQAHSLNSIAEEFVTGYLHDGQMSVVRRFFCLFVTFDLFFISLLWLICILITGDNIYNALKIQILHYSIHTSVFDIVMIAVFRFVVLLLFYAFLYINNWTVIAISTSASCIFLISKVFVYDWISTNQPVFEVILIVVSFVIAWGEAWFLDCRVIPQERHARAYFAAMITERSPLMAPTFLSSELEHPPAESVPNFYSPFDTTHNSDSENEEDDDYKNMGIECVRKAYDILQSGDWKPQKVTNSGDTIQYKTMDKLGKVYRLTGRVKYPAKDLLEELFYKVEEMPKWNPTLLESRIIRKIDTHTDISYQATVGGGAGVVKPRDFVNLRCWGLCREGAVMLDSETEDEDADSNNGGNNSCSSTAAGSVSTMSDNEYLHESEPNSVKKSTSSSNACGSDDRPFHTLSKSLGARDFHFQIDNETPPPLDETFCDANDTIIDNNDTPLSQKNLPDSGGGGDSQLITEQFTEKIYISSATSIKYPPFPDSSKYTRGENLLSCLAMREIKGKSDVCIFEWLLCLDLKGFIPRYILDTAYTTLMQDYMTYLRKYCRELRHKKKRMPKRAF